MYIMIPALGLGWLLYWLRERKLDAEEKQNPKKNISKTLTKSQNELSDWAQQMANLKKPPGPSQKKT
jgi:hypothetical protein